MPKKSNRWVLAIYYSLIFMGGAGFYSYIGLYYAQIHLNNAQIGIIASVGGVIGLLVQPLWGSLADRSPNKNVILQVALALSAITTWLLPLAGADFWLVIAATAVMGVFGSAIHPLGDSIALELAQQEKFKFSTVRTVGSLGFALMAAIAGKIFAADIGYIFPLFFLFRVGAFFNVYFVPPVAGQARTKSTARLRTLFQDTKLVVFYCYIFLLSSTFGFFNSFHAIYSKQMGIGTELVGLGIMAGSLSQFPFMIFFDKLYQKLGIVKILLISGLVYTLRWALLVVGFGPATIIPLWMLHGFNYIVLYLSLAEYISRNAPPELRTRGQVMNAMVLSGLSSIIGSSLGGAVAAAIGIRATFMASAVLCSVVVCGFLIVIRWLPAFRQSADQLGATPVAICAKQAE